MPEHIVLLPIAGTHVAGSTAHITSALTDVCGVHRVSMNAATEKVRIAFDPNRVDLLKLAEVLRSVGCEVRTSHAVVAVDGSACSSCVGRIENALRALPGVLHASVDLTAQRAIVSYLAGYLTTREIVRGIRESGHRSLEECERTRAGREGRVLVGADVP